MPACQSLLAHSPASQPLRRRQVCVHVLFSCSVPPLFCHALLPPPNAGLLNPYRGATLRRGSGVLSWALQLACLPISHDAMRSSRPPSIKPTPQPREAVDRGTSGPDLDQRPEAHSHLCHRHPPRSPWYPLLSDTELRNSFGFVSGQSPAERKTHPGLDTRAANQHPSQPT